MFSSSKVDLSCRSKSSPLFLAQHFFFFFPSPSSQRWCCRATMSKTVTTSTWYLRSPWSFLPNSGHNLDSSPNWPLTFTRGRWGVRWCLGCYGATVARVKRFEIKRPEGAPAAYVCYYIILSEDEYEKSEAVGCEQRSVAEKKQSAKIKGANQRRGGEGVTGVQLIVLTTQFRAVCLVCHRRACRLRGCCVRSLHLKNIFVIYHVRSWTDQD